MFACPCCPPGAPRGHLGRRGLLAGAALACAGIATTAAASHPGGMPPTDLSPDQALEKLMEGNRRFLAGGRPPSRADADHRAQLARGQAPFAAILGCADSRTAPELLFLLGLGDLFVVRNAGNIPGALTLGSLEYAVGSLGVPLVMVLGHERCGAVTAAIEMSRADANLPPHVRDLVLPILPSVLAAQRAGGDVLDGAVRANVRTGVARIVDRSPVIGQAVATGRAKVVGAYFDLDGEQVTLLS